MKYLILNADDFGLTSGVSKGIIEAYEYGIVSSTTLFANGERFEKDVSVLKKFPNLGVGVHLNLTHGRPVSAGVPSLVNNRGDFYKQSVFRGRLDTMSITEIEKEFTAQIEKVRASGIEITHLDSHHHIHMLPKIMEVVAALAAKYGICMRKTEKEFPDVITTTDFTDTFHNENATEIGFKMLLKKFERSESLEIMCHPGYCDVELIRKSNYTKKRDIELSVLTKYELQAHLERMGIKLISYEYLNR